jgi:hypothetical protein
MNFITSDLLCSDGIIKGDHLCPKCKHHIFYQINDSNYRKQMLLNYLMKRVDITEKELANLNIKHRQLHKLLVIQNTNVKDWFRECKLTLDNIDKCQI